MIKYPFSLDTCPLCGASISNINSWWQCDDLTKNLNMANTSLPHYYVIKNHNNEFQQTMIVMPYFLDTNYMGDTIISVWKETRSYFVTIIPQIKPDISERLLERIKNLLILS